MEVPSRQALKGGTRDTPEQNDGAAMFPKGETDAGQTAATAEARRKRQAQPEDSRHSSSTPSSPSYSSFSSSSSCPSSLSSSTSASSDDQSSQPFRSVLERLRALSWSSPFRVRCRIWSFVSAYFSLLLGGCFGLHWLQLDCWPRWTLRVFTFSGFGLYTLLDLFLLPCAVNASQRKKQRAFVRRQLIEHLRTAYRKEKGAGRSSASSVRSNRGGEIGEASRAVCGLDALDAFRSRPEVRQEPEALTKQREELRRRSAELSAECGMSPAETAESPGEKDETAGGKVSGETPGNAEATSPGAKRKKQTQLRQTSKKTGQDEEEKEKTRAAVPRAAPVHPAASDTRGEEEDHMGNATGRDADDPAKPAGKPKKGSSAPHASPSSTVSSVSSLLSSVSPSGSSLRFPSVPARSAVVTEGDIGALLSLQNAEREVCELPAASSSWRLPTAQTGQPAKRASRLHAAMGYWYSLMPWRLLWRGFYAHFLGTFVVDVVFCNAQLSPLSASIPRLVFLVLHCLTRAGVVFAANFSDLTDAPVAALWSDFLLCVATSFGVSSLLLVVPEVLHAVHEQAPGVYSHVLAPFAVLFAGFPHVRVTLPSIAAQAELPRDAREDFYCSSHLVDLVIVGVCAYLAAAAHDEAPDEARTREVEMCKDVLALVAVLDREEREGVEPASRENAGEPEAGRPTPHGNEGEAGETNDGRGEGRGGGTTRRVGDREEDPRLAALVAQAERTHRSAIQQSPGEACARRVREHVLAALVGFVAVALVVTWVTCVLLAASNVAVRMEDKTAAKVFVFIAGDGASGSGPDVEQLKMELTVLYNQFQLLKKRKGFGGALREMATMLWSEMQQAMGELRRKKKGDNAYSLLGIKPSATAREIKAAYKQLARQLHPDVIAASSPEPLSAFEEARATERMWQINEAYERLMRSHGGRGNLGRD
ncbi:putative DnaJ domain-containing protein [Neospora caninum Liverpool]|uniref:DnaJ domain-containing protein, putative n=1 Tax=Neospora caninum (strain Liverpool) TaxID=572307 RepID=F0VFM4_NEOCL|nr:putative DnaJ domain-containing protein [Neospora caninum Liverpool]CBZ52518.1 putative DnaJ domain-containing protein [Neospora caninum Liverpool]CEL66495.1 TPA: DnaJ domain-containing protein, putative [Neospora caninum Liverpool]|eukprot:XP_003882550.1 putative DnaJ domain-containing protein [Neospora caninum Liverpool]